MHGDAPEPVLVRLQASLIAATRTQPSAPGNARNAAPEHPVGRAVLALAVPILFAEIGEAAIELMDTAFLGRVGSTELAAIGPAATVLELAVAPVVGLIEAMQIVVARRTGQRREDDVVATFHRTLILVLVSSVAIAALLRLVIPAYADQLVGSREVAAALDHFFRYGAIGIVLLALNLAFSSLYVGVGRTRVLVSATAVLLVTNLVASYALILGHLGAPRLGIEGAGIAFVVAEAAALALLATRAATDLGVGGRPMFRPRAAGGFSIPQLVRLGWPISAQVLTEALRWVVFFLVVGRIGEDALAVSSVIFACYAVLVIPTAAFTETAYSMVSNLIGRKDERGVPALMRAVTTRAYAVTLPLVALCAAAPDAVLALFTNDAAMIHDAVGPLRVVSVALLLVVPADIWLGAVFGTGEVLAGWTIELAASVLMLSGAYVAGVLLDLELTYVWATLGAAATLSFVVSYLRLRSGRWKTRQL